MSNGASGAEAQTRTTAVALTEVNITFRLADGGTYAAVEQATLDVADGEFVAIVGPTGCGKSTLLNVTAGLFPPSQGRVEIFGARSRALQPPVRLLVPVRGAVSLEDGPGERRHRPRDCRARRAARRAPARRTGSRASASARLDRAIRTCCPAERKRVGLAQVLIRDPKILLMDEPFGPLDAQTRQIMGNLLLQLWTADRKAVLFVTHDLEEAIALADRVVIMSAGRRRALSGIGGWRCPARATSPRSSSIRIPSTHRDIWQTLKTEVLKGYAQTGGG